MLTRFCTCGDIMRADKHCGVYVCESCGSHLGLERCFCGWSRQGGDGRQELIDMGEVIDENA